MTETWKSAALGALGGAAIGVAIVYGAALTGNFPGQDDRHIRSYLMSHPQIFAEMSDRFQQQQDDADDQARQSAIDRLGVKRFFDPKIAFVTSSSLFRARPRWWRRAPHLRRAGSPTNTWPSTSS
jgi:hypothetical protein